MRCLICDQEIIRIPDFFQLFIAKKITEKNVCEICFSKFELISGEKCRYCCKNGLFTQDICNDCNSWKQYYGQYVKHHAIFKYNKYMQDYFKTFKRNGDIRLADVFSEVLTQQNLYTRYDVITYIPSSDKHIKIRKFNPAYELFKEVPKLTSVFKVKLDCGAQAEKNRQERLNTPQKFELFQKIGKKSKVLIVDDIYTTGRTINHCRDCLLEYSEDLTIETFSLVR